MKTLNEALDSAKKVVSNDKATKDELENTAKTLNDTMMPIGAKLYEAKTEATKPDETKSESKGDDEPLEGEVVEDKDQGKDK